MVLAGEYRERDYIYPPPVSMMAPPPPRTPYLPIEYYRPQQIRDVRDVEFVRARTVVPEDAGVRPEYLRAASVRPVEERAQYAMPRSPGGPPVTSGTGIRGGEARRPDVPERDYAPQRVAEREQYEYRAGERLVAVGGEAERERARRMREVDEEYLAYQRARRGPTREY